MTKNREKKQSGIPAGGCAGGIARRHVIIGCTMALLLPCLAAADFGVVNQANLPLDRASGIAWDGSSYFITSGQTSGSTHVISMLDGNFNSIGTLEMPANGFGGAGFGLRGMTYDAGSGNLFVVEFDTNNQVVREVTMAGDVVSTVDPTHASFMNGVAVDPDDETLWLSFWDGGVDHYAKDGTFLGGFSAAGHQWTGIEVDPVANTLLLLDNSNDDWLYEYDYNGGLVGVPLSSDQISKNGFGLLYDEYSATLFAPATPGIFDDPPAAMTVFHDPTRPTMPEPSSLMLLLGALAAGRFGRR